ncbi:MAG TPA: lipopolysaccharide assembly protein LapA domain-containing protein [bacterium]
MWIVRWIFWILVLFVIIIFVTQNVEFLKDSHTLEFLFWKTSSALPMWVIMFISFAVGILIWLIGSIFKLLELKSEVRKVSKENIVLKKELDALRNIPLDEDTDIDDSIGQDIL